MPDGVKGIFVTRQLSPFHLIGELTEAQRDGGSVVGQAVS